MKKLTLLMALFMLVQMAFAGGLLTNYNQSAQYIRMMSRNASLDIDAVFYNPAGLIKLEDGWHFSLNNQTIFQDKTISSGFPLLKEHDYLGTVVAPVFPSFYGVYKKNNLALSLGFGPVGGGGSAEFKTGMPSFEIPITKVVPGLAGLTQINPAWNVQGYDADLYFNGSSIFWGIQLGLTYKVSEAVSVFGGVRYMPSKNAYDGYIEAIRLNVDGQMENAAAWLTDRAVDVTGLSAQASGAAANFGGGAANIQPIIDGGGGSFTLEQLEGAGMISPADKATMVGGLTFLNFTPEEIAAMPVSTIQATYSAASASFAGQATQLTNTSATLSGTAALMGDKKVVTEQSGAGITPMIGLNISPNDDWNFALKYEMGTKLQLENTTEVDDLGLFPDGAKADNDIPAILALGVGFRGLDWLEAQLSYNMYFDKGVEWGSNIRDLAVGASTIRTREIDNNMWELGLGLQFNLADDFAFSIGALRSKSGIAESYQSDFSYSNPSATLGAGLMWKATNRFTLDAGISNTFYEDQEVSFTDADVGPYKETYGKTALTLAFGLSYSIF